MALVCDFSGFGNASAGNCLAKPGIKKLWLTKCENVDWEATGADFDDDLHTLNEPPTMIDGAVYIEVAFRRQSAKFDWTRGGVLQDFEANIVTIINGITGDVLQGITGTLGCCCLSGFILTNSDQLFFFGYDWDQSESVFIEPTRGMMLGATNITTGEYGADQDNSIRAELTWSGTFTAPIMLCDFGTNEIPV